MAFNFKVDRQMHDVDMKMDEDCYILYWRDRNKKVVYFIIFQTI